MIRTMIRLSGPLRTGQAAAGQAAAFLGIEAGRAVLLLLLLLLLQ
jgi:hypothetical protein